MSRRRGYVVVGAVVLALGLAACGTGEESGSGGSSAGGSVSPSLGAVERAQAALMTSEVLPVAPPGTVVDAGLGYTAEGDQVSVPWGQVWLCAGTGRPDEGPPTAVGPGALAGAWGFGRAGVAQVDQYAIVYRDEASAQAAVARARDQVEMCTDAITGNPEYVGPPPEIEVSAVPSTVDGVQVLATFTHDGGDPSDMVSTVMRSGATVLFMRANEMSAFETEQGQAEPNPDQLLDPAYVDALVAAAAAAVAG